MKKYLILFLIIGIANSYAGPPKRNLDTERMINNFTNWLIKNGHTEFVEINKDYTDECRGCDDWASGDCFEKMENQKNNVLSMEIRLMMVDTNGSKNIRIN